MNDFLKQIFEIVLLTVAIYGVLLGLFWYFVGY